MKEIKYEEKVKDLLIQMLKYDRKKKIGISKAIEAIQIFNPKNWRKKRKTKIKYKKINENEKMISFFINLLFNSSLEIQILN